jgi:hypothetical protein
MENITSAAGLKDAIHLLKTERTVKLQQLREEGSRALEIIRPVRLLQNTVNGIAMSPRLLDNIIGTAMGLATGFISKRLFIGSSGSLIRKLLGSVLQLGITTAAAHNTNFIQSFGRFAFQRIFFKHGLNTDKRGG